MMTKNERELIGAYLHQICDEDERHREARKMILDRIRELLGPEKEVSDAVLRGP